MSTFVVQTDNFEGPIELLLDLVKKRKLAISELSLALICDDYIDFVGQIAGHLKPKALSQFLVIASTLLLIKTRSLLPQVPTFEEENSSQFLDRAVLYQKLESILNPFLNPSEHKLVFEKTYLDQSLQGQKDNIDFNEMLSYLESIKNRKKQTNRLVKQFSNLNLKSQIKLETAFNVFIDKINDFKIKDKTDLKTFIKEIVLDLVGKNDNDITRKDAGIASFLSLLEILKSEKIFLEKDLDFDEYHIILNKN